MVTGYLEALVEDAEREALAHLASEVAELLGVEVVERAAELGLLGGAGAENEGEDGGGPGTERSAAGEPTGAGASGAEGDGRSEAASDAAWHDLVAGLTNAAADDQPVGPPADPAVARLLPSVSENPEIAANYRELTQHDLRIAKGDRLVRFWVHMQPENGPLLRLNLQQGEEFMATITDLRLVLAERLGVRGSRHLEALRTAQELGELGDHASGLLQVSDVLAWWQESLIFGLQMLDDSR